MALTLVSVVLVTRTFGILVDHSTESAKLLAPETVLLTLSLIPLAHVARRMSECPRSKRSLNSGLFVSDRAKVKNRIALDETHARTASGQPQTEPRAASTQSSCAVIPPRSVKEQKIEEPLPDGL